MVSGRPGPATTSGHLTQFFSVCVHTRDRRGHTDRQQLNSNYSGNSTDDVQRRRRHGGGGIVTSAAAAVAATELRWCSLRLPAAPAALLLSRCVACACACGFGCGPRPLLHRCPLRTEKRKLPELTCELGLNPPGARTRAEPRDKVHHSDARRRRRKLCTKT